MATAHIEAMRALQPEGPYLLGGFCNGGLMAYEMARQLHAQGQVVELLALIDPASPGDHRLVRNALYRFGTLTGISLEKQLELFLRYIYVRIVSYRNKVKHAAWLLSLESNPKQAKKGLFGSTTAAMFPSVKALRYPWAGVYRWIAAGYDTLKPYPGKITLFWASEAFNHCGPWREVSEAKDVEAHIFPGTHLSCKTENLHVIAERLSIYLKRLA